MHETGDFCDNQIIFCQHDMMKFRADLRNSDQSEESRVQLAQYVFLSTVEIRMSQKTATQFKIYLLSLRLLAVIFYDQICHRHNCLGLFQLCPMPIFLRTFERCFTRFHLKQHLFETGFPRRYLIVGRFTLTSLNSENGKKNSRKMFMCDLKCARLFVRAYFFFFSFFYAHKVNFKADEMYLLLHKNSRNLISRLQRHNTAAILLSNVD